MEVSSLAQETLTRLSDAHGAVLFADPALPESAARYFLDPARVRPELLPVLLANPSSPQDAITELAAKAGPDVVAVLLQHLDLLKTPALAALKQNSASPRSGRESASGDIASAAELIASLDRDGRLAMSRGDTELPAGDRLFILVLLARDSDPEVSNSAQKALRDTPDEQCLEVLTHPLLPEVVARCFLDPAHLRLALLPILLAHPNSPQDAIAELVSKAGRETLRVILEQLDLLKTTALVALKQNTAYLDWQKAPPSDGLVMEVDLLEMLIEEVEAEGIAVAEPEQLLDDEETKGDAEKKEEGLYSKLARMNVATKVVLALRGNREERAILIRDGSKVVSRAVLSSPKLSEAEVESFAALKNVSQDVLRLISMNRKFIKDYIVVRNLVNNPRLPIDIGLTLLNRLMPQDLRMLTTNRDVSETVRKMAHRNLKTREH